MNDTVESDITYTPPDNTPEGDLNAEALAAIKDIEAEWDQNDGEVVDEPEKATETPVETEEQDDPKLVRGVERLVSRELAAKERETAAEAKERTLSAKIEELKALQKDSAKFKDAADFAERMDYDPHGVLKAMGKNPADIIKLLLAQDLGDEAPDSLKQLTRDSSVKREIATLRAERDHEKKVHAAREYFNSVSNGAREWLTKTGESNTGLATAYKANPDALHAEVMEEIVRDSQVRSASDPDGEPMSYQDAYARVEARGKRLAAMFSVQNESAGTKPETKPTAPPVAKPAKQPLGTARPTAPWLAKKDDLESQGIAEAVREFQRVEADRKARRK